MSVRADLAAARREYNIGSQALWKLLEKRCYNIASQALRRLLEKDVTT